jgi:hypothetical protein
VGTFPYRESFAVFPRFSVFIDGVTMVVVGLLGFKALVYVTV